ncbi:MAG: hypothetical protein HYZ74_02405, partial [Elusimicrobia bacterium]|nr:hypothetical protein [Elusimicrobiota bacterium]
MQSAAILCTKCGAASGEAAPQCAKCGGKNARVCGGCGFQNSIAKNYCDKCGNPITEIGLVVAPPPPTAVPGSAPSVIPATAVRHNAPKSAEPASPLPAAGRIGPNPFASTPISGDPWASTPAPAPRADDKPSRWPAIAKRSLNVAAGTLGLIVSLIGIWRWSENRKPDVAVSRAATRYLDALRARDFDFAYAQFSALAKAQCTRDEFVSSRGTAPWNWSGLRVERLEPDAALLAYELKPGEAAPRTDYVLFVKENGGWARPYNWVVMQKVEDAFIKGDIDRGLVLASAAAAVNPRDPMARAYLCEAAYYRKQPQEVEKHCRIAVDLVRVL